MIDQTNALKRFFAPDYWQDSTDRFPLSGWTVLPRVNALNPRFVVDVGCGFNLFKGKIRNLIGIDLVNTRADLVCDLHDAPFADGSIDVALALGSINFGDEDNIVSALRVVRRWLVPGSGRLFMRANPGEPIGDHIAVFPWNPQNVVDLGAATGFVVDGRIDEERLTLSNGAPAKRLFWVYRADGVPSARSRS
jgi:SAM-dependent methyltransferase